MGRLSALGRWGTRRGLAMLVVLLLVATALVTFLGGGDTKTVSADFSRAVSLYEGSEVRILGVGVGVVTAVVPQGDSVRVEMEYDAAYDVPADAQAVVVTPTLVADRYVQLTPAYTGGEVLADGAEIDLRSTAVPVELDRIFASLVDLSKALGPNGVNEDGSLNELLVAGRAALEDNGGAGNAALKEMAAAAETFGDGSGELFATVRQLGTLTGVLAENDAQVRSFIRSLSAVSAQLSDERDDLQAVLAAVAGATEEVRTFVRDNRDGLSADLEALTDVVGIIDSERYSLATAIEKGPLGLGNLHLAYDVPTGSIGGRMSIGPNADDADGFLCAVVQNAEIPSADLACEIFEALIDRLPKGEFPPDGGPPPEQTAPRSNQPGVSAPAPDLRGLLGGARG